MYNLFKNINLSSGDILPVSLASVDLFVNQETDLSVLMKWIDLNHVGSKFRIYVLHPDESIDYEIPLEYIKEGGSFSENYQDGQRKSLSFSLVNEDGDFTPNINNFWAGTRFRLDMGLELPDMSVLWVQKGIFVLDKQEVTYSEGETAVSITASDKFSLFENKTGTLETSYEIPVGTEIEPLIKNILLTNVGEGYPLDIKPIVFHSSLKGKKTQATISKSAGDSYGSILLELATQLSAEIFYNSEGNLTLVPTNDTSLDIDKPLLYEYTTDEGYISGFNFSFDMSSIVNRIIVIGATSSGGVCRGEAVNDDPSSPLCYQRIGYRTGNIINDSNITTDILAKERARYELRQQLILKSSTSITVPFNPLMAVNNLVALTDDFFSLEHERFLLSSYSVTLDYSGTMSLTVTNVRNLPSLV